MRFTFFCLIFMLMGCLAAHAQTDSTAAKQNPAPQQYVRPRLDSAALAQLHRQKFVADSILAVQKHIEDSIDYYFLIPDPHRQDQFLNSVLGTSLEKALQRSQPQQKQKAILRTGQVRNLRDAWMIGVIIFLLVYTGLLNVFLSKDIRNVIQSFYNKHALSQMDKEGGLINSWAFVGLFVLFSLTAGMVLYQVIGYRGSFYYNLSGFQLFLSLSAAVSLLFALKFFVLKFVGFVFDADRIVSEYIAVLNLTYFNIAFVLLFVTVCFSLLARPFIPALLIFMLVSIVIIFTWQYLRNSVSMISNFRFHKFYLFIYLCALEICPVLILIKALNI